MPHQARSNLGNNFPVFQSLLEQLQGGQVKGFPQSGQSVRSQLGQGVPETLEGAAAQATPAAQPTSPVGDGGDILQKILQLIQLPAFQQTVGAGISAAKSPRDLRAFQLQTQLNQRGAESTDRRRLAGERGEREQERLGLERERTEASVTASKATVAAEARKASRERAKLFAEAEGGTYEDFIAASPDPAEAKRSVNKAVFNQFKRARARAGKLEDLDTLSTELGIEVSKQRLEAGEELRVGAAKDSAVEEATRIARIARNLGEKLDLSMFPEDVRLQLSDDEIAGIVSGVREGQETVDVERDLKRAQAENLRAGIEALGKEEKAPSKPLSPIAAKTVEAAKSGVKDLKELKGLLKDDFRGTLIGASFIGTNQRTKKLIKNAADVLIRFRTGAAVTLTEEQSFKIILGATTASAAFGNLEDTLKSLDDALAEMQGVVDLIIGGGAVPAGFGDGTGGTEGAELSEDERLALERYQ